ncbi:MAG TPA: hypothetical protein VIP09_06950 [Dehalococcoidia bacterium]
MPGRAARRLWREHDRERSLTVSRVVYARVPDVAICGEGDNWPERPKTPSVNRLAGPRLDGTSPKGRVGLPLDR